MGASYRLKWSEIFRLIHFQGTHTRRLADCNGQVLSFALATLKGHSFFFCSLPVLLHLLHASQERHETNEKASRTWRRMESKSPAATSRCWPPLLPACRDCTVLPYSASSALRSSCGEPRSFCPTPSLSHDPSWASCRWGSEDGHSRSRDADVEEPLTKSILVTSYIVQCKFWLYNVHVYAFGEFVKKCWGVNVKYFKFHNIYIDILWPSNHLQVDFSLFPINCYNYIH